MTETAYTEEQLRVVEHRHGHAVVAAVAGSGKTETLVGRVRYLLRDHAPERITVVMFNRDARESFRRRFERAVGGSAPEIRTFNSMGNKIVNRFVDLGLLPPAEIVEKDYRRTKLAKLALTAVFREIEGDDATPDKELIDAFIAFVLLVKTDVKSAEAVFEERRYGKSATGFPRAFLLFEHERAKQRIRFFEDQLYDPVRLMLKSPDAQRYVANKVDHLIVDEAQDVNAIQITLLKILAGTRAQVMLVGDEDQSIYEWRGARPDYLTRGFEKDFNGATRYTLPHTFRFGHALSLSASQLIAQNTNRNPKISISAAGTPDTRIRCLPLPLGLSGLGVHIRDAIKAGADPDEVAVLVRTYSMSVALELDLHHHGIPHFVYGRPPLSRIPEITAMVAVLQLACGQWKKLESEELRSLIRSLIQRPALYLDAATANALVDEVIKDPRGISDAIRSAITPRMKAFQVDQIRDRADLIEIIATKTRPDEGVVAVLDRYLIGTDFEISVEKQSATAEEAESILANVAAFKLIAAKHTGTVEAFLDEIDPLIDSANAQAPHEPHVWIGSIHRAKGAQWPHVFVPGLAARSFPREGAEAEEVEAERRLFYVAATRAVDALYLAHPICADFIETERSLACATEHTETSPVSKFLWELDLALARHASRALRSGQFLPVPVSRPEVANAYLDRFPEAEGWSYPKRERPKPPEPAPFHPAVGSLLTVGVRVRHRAFGSGTIDRWIDRRVVRVTFDSGDSRMLVAEMADLELLPAEP
ncbi:ATP-dependent helicase [Novilysobacter spongiicola]|uniref:DNA 3'-5' helicase n=1 Tax=Lysobacter spongiicola DSM 21749 TaxID=1122188 RepID=A0A1T4RZG8_9GAMM|nr:ATP-dependent helicase [Lysobacter spongiicola]SKA21098.1 DNA helicase-2 / ATP-dependent DNA helicase PcrA [Lysobacter spongiicola DSM 21749]